MIKLIDILNELNIQPKLKLGTGSTYTTYPSSLQPDKVIKILNDEDEGSLDEHYDLFIKYPKYFPIVYKKTDKYMVLEKLNTQVIRDYNNKIIKLAKEKLTLKNPELPEGIRAEYIKTPHFQKGETLAKMPIEYYLEFLDPEKTQYTDLGNMDDINWLVKQDPELARITKELHELEETVYQILQKEGIEGNGEGGRPDTAGHNNIGMDAQGNFKFLDF
jgi:hypothetical protein